MFDKAIFQLPQIHRTLVFLVLFALLEACCILGQAFGLSHALVALWQGSVFIQTLVDMTIFACSFIGVRLVLTLREEFISSYATRCMRTTRSELFEGVFRTGAPAIQAFGTGTLAAMLLEGIDKTEGYVEIALPKLVSMLVLPLAFAVAIFCFDWVSGLIVVLLLPAMILLMILIGKTTADRGSAQHATFKIMSNHFIDSVRGIDALATFKVSETYADRVYAVSERFRKATMATLKTATLSGAVLDLFATLAIAAVSIMLGLRLIDGSLTLLPALFVLILAPEYFRPIREYASDYHASLDGVNSLRTIETIIERTSDQPDPVELPRWDQDSVLQLENIGVIYPDQQVALKDITCSCSGFTRIGVIGTSGSGKSTLLRVLAGLEDPTRGQFSFDGTIQADTLRQASWQRQIAYIPQDPTIFHATLRENITFYNPDASEQRIAQALELLGLDELVRELPEGLETVIGEGGRGLSGGQAQRIALARVLLDEGRSVVLFDEPTAHLDIETEYELKAAIQKVMDRKLVIFATHRLHWLDSLDYLLILEDGNVIDQGSVEHLSARSGSFAKLVNALHGGGAA